MQLVGIYWKIYKFTFYNRLTVLLTLLQCDLG